MQMPVLGSQRTRGVVDHGFVHSIYFRDPNGYVIELTAKTGGHDQALDSAANGARAWVVPNRCRLAAFPLHTPRDVPV